MSDRFSGKQTVFWRERFDDSLRVRIIAPYYPLFIEPDGYLTRDDACHALMHYATTARNNWELEAETIRLEDEHDREINYHQLFHSIARLHGVEPEVMSKFWWQIDLQFAAMQLPLVHQSIRFDKIVRIH